MAHAFLRRPFSLLLRRIASLVVTDHLLHECGVALQNVRQVLVESITDKPTVSTNFDEIIFGLYEFLFSL